MQETRESSRVRIVSFGDKFQKLNGEGICFTKELLKTKVATAGQETARVVSHPQQFFHCFRVWLSLPLLAFPEWVQAAACTLLCGSRNLSCTMVQRPPKMLPTLEPQAAGKGELATWVSASSKNKPLNFRMGRKRELNQGRRLTVNPD